MKIQLPFLGFTKSQISNRHFCWILKIQRIPTMKMVTCRLPSLIKGHFSCHLTIGGLRSTAVTVRSSLRVCSLELKGTLVEDSKSYEGWSRHPDIILYLLVSLYVFKLFVHPVFLPHPPCQTKKKCVFKHFHGIHLSKLWISFLCSVPGRHHSPAPCHRAHSWRLSSRHPRGPWWPQSHRESWYGMTLFWGDTFSKEVITFAN